MLCYIAFIAIVNLMLGYALAVYLGATRRAIVVAAPAFPTVDQDVHDSEPPTTSTAADDFEKPETASESQQQAEPSPSIDPTTGLKTRSHFQQLLRWRATAADASDTPLTVALLEIDVPSELDQSLDDRILHNVASTVRQLISDSQTAVRYSDHQFLLLLDNDGFDKAAERAEQVRQRVEATEYVAGGDSLRATVTCALLEATAAEPEESLLEQLGQTLDEARQHGGNCTYKHDGISVSPVSPLNLGIAPQKCHI